MDQLLSGNLGEARLSQVAPAGRWHFIVIAGQRAADDTMAWAEWSDWASVAVS